MVDVEVRLADLQATTPALVDTGAPRTVFPRIVGDLIGIEFPEYPSQADKLITFLGHDWPAMTATVNLVLRPFDDPWEAEVDFVVEDGLAFALLGYEGFLNRWAVSFNGYTGYFIVEPVDDFDERQPDDVFEILEREWPELRRGP